MLVEAHVQRASERDALPAPLERAVGVAKLVELSPAGEATTREVGGSPRRVLREVTAAITDEARTRFTGKGDRARVAAMLAEVEWTIKTSFDQLLEVQQASEAEPEPRWRRRKGALLEAPPPAGAEVELSARG